MFKHPIGTKFIPIGRDCEYTVIDHLSTVTTSGEVIKRQYLCEHIFCKQKIKSTECETTISRGLFPSDKTVFQCKVCNTEAAWPGVINES